LVGGEVGAEEGADHRSGDIRRGDGGGDQRVGVPNHLARGHCAGDNGTGFFDRVRR
jgi:hypothetical protein